MSREEFTTQVDTDVLSAVRKLAREEGRQLEALVDEALSDLVEKHRKDLPRPHVMDAIMPATKNLAVSTRSSRNDHGLSHARRSACYP